jgi:hypothetical protein
MRNWNAAKVFSYKEIKGATNNFKEVIGRGSFGSVYLGKLPDGKLVAVKVRFDKSQLGADSFINEVHYLNFSTGIFPYRGFMRKIDSIYLGNYDSFVMLPTFFPILLIAFRSIYCHEFAIKILYVWKDSVRNQSSKY